MNSDKTALALLSLSGTPKSRELLKPNEKQKARLYSIDIGVSLMSQHDLRLKHGF